MNQNESVDMNDRLYDSVTLAPMLESSHAINDAFCKTEDFDNLKKRFDKELARREKWEQKMWSMLYKYKVGDKVILKCNLRGATIIKLRDDVKNYDDYKYEAKLDFDSGKFIAVSLKDSEIECLRPNDETYIKMLVSRIIDEQRRNQTNN